MNFLFQWDQQAAEFNLFREDYYLLNPFSMIVEALRWNMLNVVRVELFFNCYKLWNIFVTSKLQSPAGQYALISFTITLLAQFAAQFHLAWLLTIYSIYLAIGSCAWLKRRVYFYHKKLDSKGLNEMINHLDDSRQFSTVTNGTETLKKHNNSEKHHNHTNGSTSSSAASSSTGGHTNSLQRQRANAFQSILTEPRFNLSEYAISLAHLSNIATTVANKDVFDEMHFQILATRRDVVNILLRFILILAATLLAYFR